MAVFLLATARMIRSIGIAVRAMANDPEGRGLLTLAGALVAGGATFYRFVEDLSWLDATYFTIIALTTVGFGDFSPQTAAGKIFTIFYVLIGIGLFVLLITEIARRTMEARTELDARRRKR